MLIARRNKTPSHLSFCIVIIEITFHVIVPLASTSVIYARDSISHIYKSYQEGISCNASHPIAHPKSLKEIQNIVHYGVISNISVKAIGHLHSISDIICTDGIPVDMEHINHFRYDARSGFATVGAGTRLMDFMEKLHKVGRSLTGIPTYGDITIGGAVGTGAHGSSLRSPSTISDQMVGLTVISGLGDMWNISKQEELDAFRAHLGLLGIIFEVVVRTVPQFKIESVNYPVADRILEQGGQIIELARSNDFFQFWWFPSASEVVISRGNRVPTNTSGEYETHFVPEFERDLARGVKDAIEIMQEGCDELGLFLLQTYSMQSLFRPVIGKPPIYATEAGRHHATNTVGFSHRMLASKCEKCIWAHGEDSMLLDESEVVIPVDELPAALITMKTILQEHPIEFYITGILFRFITPSSGLLNVNRDRESVGIEWIHAVRTDRFRKAKHGLPTMQALVQALVKEHKGRTHWGKNGLYYSSPAMIHYQHGSHVQEFVKHMEQFDPKGTFLNDFGRRLRFQDVKMTIGPGAKHCALADHCLCQTDLDCGEGGSGDYTCGKIRGYNVCVESFTEFQKHRKLSGRNSIRRLQPLLKSMIAGWNIRKALNAFRVG